MGLMKWLNSSYEERNAQVMKFQTYQATWLRLVCRFLGLLSEEEFYLLNMALLVWGPICSGSYRFAFALGLLLPYGMGIATTFKNIFAMPRPSSPPVWKPYKSGVTEFEFSFPSAHAVMSTCYAMQIAYHNLVYLGAYAANPSSLYFWVSFVLLWSGSISLSRVYLGVHTFQDIAVGWVLGCFLGLLWNFVILEICWYFLMGSVPVRWFACLVIVAILLVWLAHHPINRKDKMSFHLSEGTFDYFPPLIGLGIGILACGLSFTPQGLIDSVTCLRVDQPWALFRRYMLGAPFSLSLLLGSSYGIYPIVEIILKKFGVDANYNLPPSKFQNYILNCIRNPEASAKDNTAMKLQWVRVVSKVVVYFMVSYSVLIALYF